MLPLVRCRRPEYARIDGSGRQQWHDGKTAVLKTVLGKMKKRSRASQSVNPSGIER